jgi:hypothetical protein
MAGRKRGFFFFSAWTIAVIYGILFLIYAFIALFNATSIQIMNSSAFPSCLFFWKENLLDLLSINRTFYFIKALLLAGCVFSVIKLAYSKKVFLIYYIVCAGVSCFLPSCYIGRAGLHAGDIMLYLLVVFLLCAVLWHKGNTSLPHEVTDKEEKQSTEHR